MYHQDGKIIWLMIGRGHKYIKCLNGFKWFSKYIYKETSKN